MDMVFARSHRCKPMPPATIVKRLDEDEVSDAGWYVGTAFWLDDETPLMDWIPDKIKYCPFCGKKL